MLNSIFETVLRNRLLAPVLLLLAMALGIRAMFRTPVDAFPDTTPVQVQVNTVAPALNPLEIEQEITAPVELSISGLPGLENVRSVSKFGFSQIVATFEDGVDIYDARQLVLERIGGVELPEGIARPQLGPIATGLGEIFHYIIASADPGRGLDEIRALHDWVIKPELRKVSGVAEVNSWGGYELQYQVVVQPDALAKFGLTLRDVAGALESNNANAGGGQIVSGGQSLLVHGKARVGSLDQIGGIVIRAKDGVPVRIRDVAEVRKGHEIRRGAVTAQGKGEAVLGLAFMLMGENSKEVAENLRKRLDQIRPSLPEDIRVDVVYDRTSLVSEVIGTVRNNLIAGALLVIAVLFLVMGDFRAGLLVAMTIPLSLIFAFLGMYPLSIAASLLSLGAIDFGILVDGSVVMTDVNRKALAEARRTLGRPLTRAERLQAVLRSSRQVLRPTFFGMAIIALVFVPVLALEGVEGKMFKPMAWTFIFALLGALILAVTLTPLLNSWFLPDRSGGAEGRLMRRLGSAYAKSLEWALGRSRLLLAGAAILLGAAGILAFRLGGEFMPRLSEGSIAINTIRLAGISIEESARYNTRIEQFLLKEFPGEVDRVWSRIGAAEVATDPMGIELTDIFVRLKPRREWTRARTQEELAGILDSALRDFPGQNMVFTQPIELRMNEMASGIRTDIGIKVYGDDLDELVRLGDAIQAVLVTVPGNADVSGDQITGQPMVEVEVDQEKIARLGIPARDVLQAVAANGNLRVGDVIDGQRRFPLVIRLPDAQRARVDALADLLIPASTGALVPLRQVARVAEVEGPATLNREWGRRLIKVQANVRGRDVASFVAEARRRVAAEVDLPEGYVVEWGGQFENLERSRRRLLIVVPLTLLAVFMMLHFSLGNVRDVLIIGTGIPFAAVGGVLALWARGMPFSVSAAVGFIALCGIVVLNGQLLVSGIRQRRVSGLPLIEAVKEAGRSRLQPILATALTDAAGFIPMALSSGAGSEVQRPLATVVIGGVLTSTALTLFVMPVLFARAGRGKAGMPMGDEAGESAGRGGRPGRSEAALLPEDG